MERLDTVVGLIGLLLSQIRNIGEESKRLDRVFALANALCSPTPPDDLHIAQDATTVTAIDALKVALKEIYAADEVGYNQRLVRVTLAALKSELSRQQVVDQDSAYRKKTLEIHTDYLDRIAAMEKEYSQKLYEFSRRPKKIVVCCDGTWNAPEKLDPSEFYVTNVLKASRAVLPKDSQGRYQIVEYVRGIGSGNFQDRYEGGITGKGISPNILQAYQFIANNYERGDEIYLFGFSRGAYTARSLSGFLNLVGILRKEKLERLPQAYSEYQRLPRSEHEDIKNRYRDAINSELANEKGQIPVQFLGVWETVGSLGVPVLSRFVHDFHDTQLSPNVTHAYHALAIHEFREQFKPTLWTRKSDGQQVQQVWFPGAHSDVGGGVSQPGLSNLTLQWMMARAGESGLEINADYLAHFQPNICTPLSNPYVGKYKLHAPFVRTMGRYNSGINQFLHPLVRKRLENMPGTHEYNRDWWVKEADERSMKSDLAPATISRSEAVSAELR